MNETHRGDAVSDAAKVQAWRDAIRTETFANYHCEMGKALWRNGDRSHAVAAFERALAIRANYPEATVCLMDILKEMGDTAAAERVRRTHAGDRIDVLIEGYRALASSAGEGGRHGEAHAHWSAAYALSGQPEDRVMEAVDLLLDDSAGSLSNGAAILEGLRNAHFDDSRAMADRLFTGAGHLALRGRFAAAESVLVLGASLGYRTEDFEGMLGQLSFRTGNHAQALTRLDAAIAANDRMPHLHMYRGLALMGLNRLDEAEEAFERSVRLAPEEPLYRSNAALIDLRRGRTPSQSTVEELQKTAAVWKWIAINLGLVQEDLGNRAAADHAFRQGAEPLPHWAAMAAHYRPGFEDRVFAAFRRLAVAAEIKN